MRQFIVLTAIILFCFSSVSLGQTVLQAYPQGKIYLKSGIVVEGKSLEITKDQTKISIAGNTQTFELADVQQIQAKVGKGKRYAKTCSAGCIGLSLGSYMASGGKYEDPDTGEIMEMPFGAYLLSSALYGAVFYLGGYLMGSLSDSRNTVYFSND